MYWKDEGEDEETLKSDMVRDLGNAALAPGYVVSSSDPVPAHNDPGDNPPHAKAKRQYERIVPNDFLCTHQHPNPKNPEPIVFEISPERFRVCRRERIEQVDGWRAQGRRWHRRYGASNGGRFRSWH